MDIGANIGHMAIEATLKVEAGRVLAFEAPLRTARYLRENLKLNGLDNVIVAQLAAGNLFGWARISDLASDGLNKMIAEGTGITVPVVRLEPFMATRSIFSRDLEQPWRI